MIESVTVLIVLCLYALSLQTVVGDCDLSGLCFKIRSIFHATTINCNADEECIQPSQPDCFSDRGLPNEFYCDPSDCVVIQTLTGSKSGCREYFPNIKNTMMEEHSSSPLSDEFPENSFTDAENMVVSDVVGGGVEPKPDRPILQDGQLKFYSALRKKRWTVSCLVHVCTGVPRVEVVLMHRSRQQTALHWLNREQTQHSSRLADSNSKIRRSLISLNDKKHNTCSKAYVQYTHNHFFFICPWL